MSSRVDLGALVAHHLEAGEPTGWFEPLYAAAGRDPSPIPWVRRAPHPYLVDWLAGPVTSPPGRRAVVIGCGWGDDAALLAEHGYEVAAFDVAPSAVARARRRFRRRGVDWRVADLLALPDGLEGAFDLVVEVETVPWLPGVVRDAAMQAVASLAAPRGVVVAVTKLATSDDARGHVDGPPWPQAPSERAAYPAGGLVRLALEHPTPDGAPVMDVRLTWQRPAGLPVTRPGRPAP
jgi:SAM-dependent methyltransferase